MELTKQDKKHIQEQTRKLSFRIVEEAKEYSRLYERTYYEEVIKACQMNIEAIDSAHEMIMKLSDDGKTWIPQEADIRPIRNGCRL